jgi:hypothetical protein
MRVVLETILRNTFSSLFDQPLISFRCHSSANARHDHCAVSPLPRVFCVLRLVDVAHAAATNCFSQLPTAFFFRILSEVEAIVSCIFDPDGYHKRLPMLSSTTTGIRESATHVRDPTHSPRGASLHSKFFTMSPVVHELAAMSQVPQIRVMAAKARSVARGNLPSRDTIAQIVPPALLTQTSRSILCVQPFTAAERARCDM